MNNQHSTAQLWNTLYSTIAPASNTGKTADKKTSEIVEYKDYLLQETTMLIVDGEVKPVLFRKPANSEICVIDWLNVTLQKSTFTAEYDEQTIKLFDDDYYITLLDVELRQILGYGIAECMHKGMMYYQNSYRLENDCGFVCIGGQRDTILISLNGTGCLFGEYAWAERMYKFLQKADRAKITRIDYTHDDLQGDYVSVDWADKQDDEGGFVCHRVNPTTEKLGDWKLPNGSGRTFNVGKRTSSKFCRIYEKGKQLGDKNSDWTRVEVEYKSKHF